LIEEKVFMEHILIVDDEEDLVWAVSKSLQLYDYTVSTAYNGAAALQQIQRNRPDLLMLDMKMPVMDGVELCHQLRRNPSQSLIPIIFLTVQGELDHKIAAYTAGADDYLTKPFDMHELILRIRAVLRRAKPPAAVVPPPPSPTQLQVGRLCLDLHLAAIVTEGKHIEVTPCELDLLKFMMQNPGQVFSSEELLQNVWHYPAGTGDPTLVRWHVKNLRRKIEPLPEEPIYLRTVPRHGYIFVDATTAAYPTA
jgi:DNA-binding response OmpR family regulator